MSSPIAVPPTLRVNPYQPLSSSIPLSASLQASSIPDGGSIIQSTHGGLNRTTSRRRKAGDGTQLGALADPQVLPAAPDVPEPSKGPPLAYHNLSGANNTIPTRSNSSRSFAARAGAIPGRLDPSLGNPISANRMPISETNGQPRRASTGQTPGITYPQVRQPQAPFFSSSSVDPSSPQPLSSAHPKNVESTSRRLPLPIVTTDLPTAGSNARSPPVRAGMRHVSASTAERRTEWAPDKSPLQKLEVKLNDISKEEKRARVQEAEQLLRESQAAKAARKGPITNNGMANTTSKSTGSGTGTSGLSPIVVRAHTQDQNLLLPGRSGVGSAERPLVDGSLGEVSQARGETYSNTTGRSGSLSAKSPQKSLQVASPAASDPSRNRSTNTSTVRRGEERGVRFQNIADVGGNEKSPTLSSPTRDTRNSKSQRYGDVQEVAHSPSDEARRLQSKPRAQVGAELTPTSSGRKVPAQQQQLYAERTGASMRKASTTDHDDASGPSSGWHTLSGIPGRSSDGPLTYEIPPQSASGIIARKIIGFGSSQNTDTQDSHHHRHHFSGLLQHGRGKRDQMEIVTKTKNLDEWRRAGVARLTLADIAPDEDSTESSAWWEKGRNGSQRRSSASAEVESGSRSLDGGYEGTNASTAFEPPLLLKCGPLLRYTGLRRDKLEEPSGETSSAVERETWRGSVMIVTVDTDSTYVPAPVLRLFHQPMDLLPPPPQNFHGGSVDELPSEYVDPIAGLPKMTRTGGTVYVKPVEDLEEGVDYSRIEDDDGLYEVTRTANVPTSYGKADELLGRSPLPAVNKNRLNQRSGQQSGRFREVRGIRLHTERGCTFWRFNIEVELGPTQARIAYRINHAASIGFWVPARGQTMNMMFHSCNGFSLSVNPADFSGPDGMWRDVLNTHQTKPFHVMLGGGDQIYNDAVMRDTEHFQAWLELKNPHHKHEAEFTPELKDELETFYLNRYAMWFSQGLFGMANSQIPMVNVWDDHDIIDGFGSYPDRFMTSPVFSGLGNVAFKYYMLFQHQSLPDELTADEPSWLLGASPGPYINELSRSLFMFLGKQVAFLGLDCRTERMRDEIMSADSYDIVFDRCRREIIRGETKHLIVLLGVPIAYPRLVWLENILTSRVMDPIKALGRTGLLGGFLNKFDGGVEILDDLDDHWTARNHKHERNWFVEELQQLAAEKSVRVIILGGDVHLAAIGQFYSNKKLNIPKDRDPRYMPNVISSAIVNTPPPEMMGDILNKRNKIHHLNPETDEDMIPMFTHDVDGKPRNNKRLLPRRNWCSISAYQPGSTPLPTPPISSADASEESIPQRLPNKLQRTLSLTGESSKPVGLFRRLSGRAPPSPGYSPDEDDTQSPPPRSTQDGYFPKTTTSGVNGNAAARNVSAPLPTRPINSFHRRPTNLSEKAAAKGGATTGEISLEHGLDVVLNCEVSQRDPAGCTVPYRLLVPALWYDEGVEGLKDHERKRSIIKRIGSRRGAGRLMGQQPSSQWSATAQSETESESEREMEIARFGSGKLLKRNVSIRQNYSQPQGQVPSQSQSPSLAPVRQNPDYNPNPTIGLNRRNGSLRQPAGSSINQTRPLDFSPDPVELGPGSGVSRGNGSLRQPPNSSQPGSPLARHPQPLQAVSPQFGPEGVRVARQRIGSKFDADGNSKFFGTVWGESSPTVGTGGNGGYGGIDAYKEKGKGWKRFF